MKKTDALVLLVSSLTKAEKKNFSSHCKKSDYSALFRLIDKDHNVSAKELKQKFKQKHQGANFDATVTYLYKVLLDSLSDLRRDRDRFYCLFDNILKARILFEKSLFEEALDLLSSVKKEALVVENFYAMLYASRLELEYLMFLNFANITETALVNKHFHINEIQKKMQKISEQSALYEMLKYRLMHKGYIHSQKQKNTFNDLVISEINISSSNKDSFEIKKLHLLFQSNYLIGIGDHESASNSLRELNQLFENNRHLWNDPPFYYVSMLEGILDNLRSIGSYDEMPYYIGRLKNIRNVPAGFQAHVSVLIFLYELFPYLDRGDFRLAKQLVDKHKNRLFADMINLNLMRRAELSLCLSIIHLGLGEYKKAQSILISEIIHDSRIYSLPLYRTIRLISLIIHYELEHNDIIEQTSRSIKRGISKTKDAYRVEYLMLDFLNKSGVALHGAANRKELLRKLSPEMSGIRNNIFERQILKNFDFIAWIESKLTLVPLSEILGNKFAHFSSVNDLRPMRLPSAKISAR
ncbi:MAG: hypothetical protein LBR50_08905 [Tannerella sp.]|nr:hypothetical protein [Tannerella sp.]